MTELTLSQRLRVAAAIHGPLTLELTAGQAAELIRLCADMESNSRKYEATQARFEAMARRREWLCRMNDEVFAPLFQVVLALVGASAVIGIAKDLLN
jgi:hypothetical protein